CQGIAKALGKKGHKIQFMLPRLYGKEVHSPNVELFDVKSRLSFLSEDEINSIGFLNILENPDVPLPSAYQSADYIPAERKSMKINEILSPENIVMSGGYGPDLYNEIHRYAKFAEFISQKIHFDVIHVHDWMTYPAGLAVMEKTGKPLICHVHATEFDRSGEKVNQYVYDLERNAFERCTKIITVSNFTKSLLLNRYGIHPDKIYPVHNAVEFEIPAGITEQPRVFEDKLILFLGRITFQKGPDYFVRAAKKVIEKVSNVRFLMVGTGDMYHRMIELAADLGIGKYFHYTGFLNREQVRYIYSISDLYVMPSVSEPFGISPLEAMMHGIPVIVSKQSGVSEILASAIKVDFWDVEALADQIIQLISDSELNHELKEKAKSELLNITWDDSALKISQVYDSLKVN
ncbi:MAG: glycosyltransferase, partial [Spirochaetia bacterium]|nr:glycosyltransferase [Spirochaetia bacterium]